MDQEGLFKKRIFELTASDLTILTTTAEGWFCEYKQQVPKPAPIAKSISSFANSYGGWLFYGVKANKSNRCAEELCGMPIAEVSQVETWIRQAVSGALSPAAYFDHKVIAGPLSELGLRADHAIIAVYVPQGVNAPYVHSSGKIYRRVADESDPKEETDRHFLDLLWNRSRSLRDELRDLITQEPPRQNPNDRRPLLKLMIFHDVWKARNSQCPLGGEDFHRLMTDGSLVFDTIYPTNAGYLARQVKFNDPLGLIFGWHHRRGCIDELTIPLNTYSLSNEPRVRDLDTYEYAQEYISLCRKGGAGDATLIDLSVIYSLLLSIFLRLNDFLLRENVSTDVFFKLQIAGMSGCVPFLDVPDFVRAVEAYGIPVIQDHVMYAPPGFTPESLDPLFNVANPRSDLEKDGQYCAIMNCAAAFFTLCRALGVDLEATGFDGTDGCVVQWHERLQEAANRSYGVSAAIRDRQARLREA
jgi:hypothetical protein